MKTNNTKTRFYDSMRESLLRLKPEEMEITFKRIDKQNRKGLHGCALMMPDSAAAPTFYFEDLYEAYQNGTAVDDIAQSLINYAVDNNLMTIPGGIDIEDYESVKENLGIIVIGEENNREYLAEMVYEKIEDLALMPIIFTNDSHGTGCIKIRKEFLSHTHNGIVLHNKTVWSYFVQIREKTIKTFCFALFADSVYSNINLLLLFMKTFNGSLKLIPGKIRCTHSRIKTSQAKINSVRAFTNSGIQRFNISRRS